MNTPSLYTFGYEGLDISAFIARLKEAGVHHIADVRELPLSRKKGFSKSAFRERLAEAGIAYSHWPALGCPKPIRNQYRQDANWSRYTQDFLAYLQTQTATVRELAQLARETSTCLVCFEADFSMCHRTFVARASGQVGAPPVHHLTAKTVFPDQSLWAAA